MHRIIEQTAILCGMVKTPNPASHRRDSRPDAEYHPRSKRAQGAYRRDEAREKTLQKVADAHSFARLRGLLGHQDRPCSLLFSHHGLHDRVGRFVREGPVAFDDRKRRGPAPLLGDSARKLIEELTEQKLPTERGWLRSRWSCKLLALEMFKQRALVVSQETIRRVLH